MKQLQTGLIIRCSRHLQPTAACGGAAYLFGYNKRCEILCDLIALIRVDDTQNLVFQVKAQNSHDRFCVGDIPASDQIDVKRIRIDGCDKILHVFDIVELPLYR